jgi:HEAT repeat protein
VLQQEEIRVCLTAVAQEYGWKIKSLYCNPLTKAWQVDLGDHSQVSFKPEANSTIEECASQFKKVLGVAEVTVAEEIDSLRVGNPDAVFASMQRLRKRGTAALEPLVAALLDQTETVNFRCRIADTLAMIGSDRAVEPLLTTLSETDPQIRWHAMQALAEIGDHRALAPLADLACTETGEFSITPGLRVSLKDEIQKAVDHIKARLK